jgi:hypothetical protein
MCPGKEVRRKTEKRKREERARGDMRDRWTNLLLSIAEL